MKKFLMAIFALVVATSVATAGVGIQWEVGWGGYAHDAPNITGSTGYILDSSTVIWQLIYTGPNGVIDSIPLDSIPTAGGPNGDYVQGDDVVWAQRNIAQDGTASEWDIVSGATTTDTTWGSYLNYTGGGSTTFADLSWNTAGSVYQRVFEGTPADQSWFYDSPTFAFDETWTDTLPAEGFNPERAQGAGFQPDQQFNVIPEPATMGLLGLGALVMAIRRRRS